MEGEFKPCPKCGSVDISVESSASLQTSKATCDECRYSIQRGAWEENMWRHWNKHVNAINSRVKARRAAKLRTAIIAEMKRYQKERDEQWREVGITGHLPPAQYCTWWFKFHIPYGTKEVRRELEKMERDGLVTSDRSESNNTRWTLVEGGDL